MSEKFKTTNEKDNKGSLDKEPSTKTPEAPEKPENPKVAKDKIIETAKIVKKKFSNKKESDRDTEKEASGKDNIPGGDSIDTERVSIITKAKKKVDKIVDKDNFNKNKKFLKNLLKYTDKLDLVKIQNITGLNKFQLIEYLGLENEKQLISLLNKFKKINKNEKKSIFQRFKGSMLTRASFFVALITTLNSSPNFSNVERSIDNIDKEKTEINDYINKKEKEAEKTFQAHESDFESESESFLENLEIKDKDLLSRGNKEFIERYNIKVEQEFVEIGQEKFLINILSKEGPNKQNYLVVHDSENASFDSGLRAIKNGGKLVSLGNNESRFLYCYENERIVENRQDPNRMFSEQNPYWPLAERILELVEVDKNELLIVLHNNHPHRSFNIPNIENWSDVLVYSDYKTNSKNNVNNLIWLSGDTKEPSEYLKKEIEKYQKKGINVVYEHVRGNRDGSLSNYIIGEYNKNNNNPVHYINIETQKAIGGPDDEKKCLEMQEELLMAVRDVHSLNKSGELADLSKN